MARNYTLEDVETLRRKSGVSYEDAVALLDKYDGDLARAMVELEKRGQLGGTSRPGGRGALDDAGDWVRRVWRQSLQTRVVIERKGDRLAALPALVLLLLILLGYKTAIAAVILILVTGCNVSLQKKDEPEQTILHAPEDLSGEDAEANPTEEASAQDGEAEKKDDDFPSMTIS